MPGWGDFETLPLPYSAVTPRVFEWLDALAAGLSTPAKPAKTTEPTEPSEPVAFWEWLASAAAHANPFVADLDADPYLPGQWARWDRTPEETFTEFLCHYLGRLSSLGAVALSKDDQGNLGVSLTPIGRYQFGQAGDWKLAEEARPVAVVGGDFSIVLLHPAPDLALELDALHRPGGERGRRAAVLALPPFAPFRAGGRASGHDGGGHAAHPQRVVQYCRFRRTWSMKSKPGADPNPWCASRKPSWWRARIPVVMADILSRFPRGIRAPYA